jgi:RNA polymerase sigma-70 factor (ECF subfamily)
MTSVASGAYSFRDEVEPAPPRRACLQGSSRALAAELFGPEQMERLQRIACRYVRMGLDPDDLLHDAVERALTHLDRFERGTNFIAWMSTILSRLALDSIRKRQRQRTESADVSCFEAPAREEPEPWAALDADDLRAAAAELPRSMRETFSLAVFDGLSYEQIAARSGISQGTVGSRLLRARLKLRSLLQARLTRRRAPLAFPVIRRTEISQ